MYVYIYLHTYYIAIWYCVIVWLFFAAGPVSEDAVSYCERVLELLLDLEAQLPTRRFFNTLLDSTHFVVSASGWGILSAPEGWIVMNWLGDMYNEVLP